VNRELIKIGEAQAAVMGIGVGVVVVEGDLKFHRVAGGNVAVLVEGKLPILDEQSGRAKGAGEVQALAARGEIELECGLAGVEEDNRVGRIGKVEPDDQSGTGPAFDFQRCIALEFKRDAAEGIEVKVDGQGL